MANPRLPQNQIASLPLMTPEAAGDSGDLIVVGTKVVKYWSPSVLGISNAPYAVLTAPNGYGARGFLSNMIDTTGCNYFNLMFMVQYTTAEAALRTWTFYFQPQFDPAQGGQQIYSSLADGSGATLAATSLVLLDTAQMKDNGATILTSKQYATRGFSLADTPAGAGSAAGATNRAGVLTTRGRLFIDCNTTLTTPADARVWVSLHGMG